MTDCILYTRQDESVVILHPAAHSGLKGEKPNQTLARIIHEVVPTDAVKVLVVDSRNLPTDYRFHGAWQLQGANIGTDMAKARDIHRDRIRAARMPLMAQLDIEYQRADEVGDLDKKREIAQRKQVLRDAAAHPDIEAAQTPDELARVWPFEATSSTLAMQEPVLLQRKPDPQWSMSELLARAANEPSIGVVLSDPVQDQKEEEPPIDLPAPEVMVVPPQPPIPLDDTARRRAAKAHIRGVAASFAFSLETERLRYEMALMAHNGAVKAIEELADEARGQGVSVRDLAERIVDGHTAHARRMMLVKSVQDRALAALNTATGDDIAAIEQQAVAEMTGDV